MDEGVGFQLEAGKFICSERPHVVAECREPFPGGVAVDVGEGAVGLDLDVNGAHGKSVDGCFETPNCLVWT